MRRLLVRSLGLAVATLLLASPIVAQKPAAFDPAPYRIDAVVDTLSNGLRYAIHSDHSVPLVAVNIWYHVGSRNEERGRTGFAHLFEHFFFNGSENYPHGFREAMDDLGASNRNGTTNTDRTTFYEDVPTAALERTLYLEADRMGFLAGRINAEMLERERGVVKNEKRQNENQPYGKVWSFINENIYPYSHPYSWSTIGSMQDLDAASLEDVRTWYSTYYGPNNAVVVLAGDITPERGRELIEKYFGGIPPGPPLRRLEAWVPSFERNLRATMQDNVPQTRIYRIYHAPQWGTRGMEELGLAASVLSGSRSSRLDRRLVYEKGLVTGVSAYAFGRELSGIFGVMATVKPGVDPGSVEAEIDDVLAEFLRTGPTTAELERAKARALAGVVRRMERLGAGYGRGDILAESMTYGGSPDAWLDQLEMMANAGPADVRTTASTWLNAPHFTLTVEPMPKLQASSSDLDRSILPPLGTTAPATFPGVERGRLKNGMEVVLVRRTGVPLVNLSMVFNAGYTSDPKGKDGLASMALELMKEGTTSRDGFALLDELDAIGASIESGGNLDQSWLSLSTLSSNLKQALALFADVIRNPSFPEEKFTIAKQSRLAAIAQEKANPTRAGMRFLFPLLYGEQHPYGRPPGGLGETGTVSTITREDLRAWRQEWLRPANGTVVVAGDVSMERLLPMLEGSFGDWKGGGAPARERVAMQPPPATPKVYLLDRPGAVQSVILAGHITGERGDDDVAIETVMQNFGGIATSRLNRNLRLDKHWSYGTFAFISDVPGARPFMLIAPVQSDKTKEAMAELVKEVRDIAGARPITGEEYASTMRNMTLGLPARWETLDALEGAMIESLRFRLPDDYWQRYGERIRALSESDLAKAGSGYIHPDRLTWIVVGDATKIEAGIRELGLGEVVRVESVR